MQPNAFIRIRRQEIRSALLTIVVALGVQSASAQQTTSTLTLDSLSVISFGEREMLAIPSGSTLTLHFSQQGSDGTWPFVIHPEDVAIPSIALSTEPGYLDYSLAEEAKGFLEETDGGYSAELTATISATIRRSESDGTQVHALHFTTGSTSAENLAGTKTISISGVRIDPTSRYVQLVGASTNPENARPEPGAAVYAVLSGKLDSLPDTP